MTNNQKRQKNLAKFLHHPKKSKNLKAIQKMKEKKLKKLIINIIIKKNKMENQKLKQENLLNNN